MHRYSMRTGSTRPGWAVSRSQGMAAVVKGEPARAYSSLSNWAIIAIPMATMPEMKTMSQPS
jgi:hypothetical protein